MMHKWSLRAFAGVATCAVLGATAAAASSCSTTPVNVPVRTFEQPQKLDAVCMQVYDTVTGARIAPRPVVQSQCAPVPTGVIGEGLPFHLYALVTQRTRGEVAVVDLTGGYVVDIDHSTPGINFIPVGAQPTDIAAAPDGQMAFVTAAEPNKPALYAVATSTMLGDSQQIPGIQEPIPTLTSIPACSLPQAPIAIAVVPRSAPTQPPAPDGDAGSDAGNEAGSDAGLEAGADAGLDAGPDAGGDGGAPTVAPQASYELLVLLAGSGAQEARLVSVNPTQLLQRANVLPGDAGSIASGSLTACAFNPVGVTFAKTAPPSNVDAPSVWPDGIPYVDGGVSLTNVEPAPAANCTATDGGLADAGTLDGGSAGGPLAALPRPFAMVFDDQSYVLYVADGSLPLIHAFDLSTPGALRELPPLVASSADDPARIIAVGSLAISPSTRDLKRYLYALDQKVGTIMVFDVTTPPSSPRGPMRRPHPELNPFQPSDRIAFGSPVAAVAFVQHDWPVSKVNSDVLTGARTGLLCNPNPGIDPSALGAGSADIPLGALYGYGRGNQPLELGPYRLRGVFALATLTNGSVVTIDVDDWDAPCRRPDPLDNGNLIDPAAAGQNRLTDQVSDLAIPEPVAGAGDLDPYHAPAAFTQPPNAGGSPVTVESFFPISAPNRVRSSFLLRNDPQTGNHSPNLVGQPQLFSSQAQLPTTGVAALPNPALRPTFSLFADPSFETEPTNANPAARGWSLPANNPTKPFDYHFALPGAGKVAGGFPGVRVAFEVPDVHVDQDWSVTYEGVVPGFEGIAAAMSSTDGYRTMTLSASNALFCGRGVEDVDTARARVAQQTAAMATFKIPPPDNMQNWTGDYVQIADDIVDVNDPYWASDVEKDFCWGGDHPLTTPQARHDACQSAYGSLSDATQSVYRDFPILQAYDDQLVVGRFGYGDPNALIPTNRQIVSSHPSNVLSLKLAYCCFHHQATFHVRASGQWVTVGSASGFLHHMTTSSSECANDANGKQHCRCVESCDPRLSLLNARAPELPLPIDPMTKAPIDPGAAPDRNSPLAMRNPFFSFLMWSGAAPVATGTSTPPRTSTVRDYVWHFSMRGQLAPLSIALASGTPQVDPQSMRFIASLGQLAVVDGASQGLVLIDLNTVAPAHSPYF